MGSQAGKATRDVIWRRPAVAGLLAGALVARLPLSVMPALLAVVAREVGSSRATTGFAAAGFGLGLTAGAPLLGRLADRRGETGVLVACSGLTAAVLVAVALASSHLAREFLPAAGVALGLAAPPVGACLRARLARLAVDAGELRAVYGLESASLEITYVAGPILLIGGAGASRGAPVVASAALVLGGVAAYLMSGRSARRQPAVGADSGPPRAAPMALGSLIATLALVGVSIGCIEVGVPLTTQGRATGWLLGAWSAGSLAAGLWVARRAAGSPRGELLGALLVLAAGSALLPIAPSSALLAPALVLAGAGLAPTFTYAYGLAADAREAGSLTEAFSWLMSGVGGGAAVGALAAGPAAVLGPSGPFVLAAVSAGLAAAVHGAAIRAGR